MNDQRIEVPETWKDEETIDADFRLHYLDQLFEYPEEVRAAFRAGWKAGARQATMNMWRWILATVFGHKEPAAGADPEEDINEEGRNKE